MAYPSTYHLQQSLPHRSPSARPLSLSLADYQPLAFDREALEAAYQTSLAAPASSATSWQSHPSTNTSAPGSTDTHGTSPSTLSSHLKPGDNPHSPPRTHANLEEPPVGGFAGVGAGHSLTPPQSPFHKPAQLHQQSLLTPSPPLSPSAGARRGQTTGKGRQRSGSLYSGGLDMDDFEAAGYDTDPGPVVSGRRRDLPLPPTNVPAPVSAPSSTLGMNAPAIETVIRGQTTDPQELPAWEPDYKPHIPAGLTEPSIQNAYAQLGAPPPNLPPRRTQPNRYLSSDGAGPSQPAALAGPSNSAQANEVTRPPVQTALSSSTIGPGPVPGAPSYPPITSQAGSSAPSADDSSRRVRPEAEKEVQLRATERTPIWSTHFLDPCLRNSLINIPHQVSNVANIALSSLSSGQKQKYNQTIGAPIDGLARMAKDWVVPPDGKFQSENGGIEIGLGVIDSGMQDWGNDKGRKRARVEVTSRMGGIKVDIIEIAPNRQLDLRIDTKTGDVLVLLPDDFHGPIHVNSAARPPIFLGILRPQLLPINKPYNTFYTTFAVPLAVRRNMTNTRPPEHRATSQIERIPESFREQSELFDQIAGGYASHTRGEQSKVHVTSQKGRVVIGYRESRDEAEAQSLGLQVGAQSGGKKKRWWRG